MTHYDYIEWLLYKNNALSKEKAEEMEEHLYDCDLCMDIFLSLIDEDEIELASRVIPKDFTSNVVDVISKDKLKAIEPKYNKKAFNYQFMYYVAVASVTIFMTFGGFYENLVESVPRISQSFKTVEEERPNHIVEFSDIIVKSTSSLLSRIENKDQFKEENNEK